MTPFQGRASRATIDAELAAGATIEVLPAPLPEGARILARVDADGTVDFVVRGDAPGPGATDVGLVDRPSPTIS